MKMTAIVLAAGSGSRMKSDIPKQYLQLNNYPVMYHSLKTFNESFVDEIILVVPQNDIEYCNKEIVQKYGLKKVTNIVAGGSERYYSVYNAITSIDIEEEHYIFVHDAARPLLTNETLEKCKQSVIEYGTAVAGVPVKDTIKIVDSDKNVISTPDRSTLWQVQTPQCFNAKLLKNSYEKMIQDLQRGNITDDAQVVEKYSNAKVKMIESEYTNIKITTPEDIKIAEKSI